MGIATIIASIVSGIGSAVSGFFGFKNKQGDVVATAIETIGGMAKSDSTAAMAAALAIASETSNGSWMAANWRPMFAIACGVMIVGRWFGYVPEGISPEEIDHVYTLMEIMIGGYVGGRSLEKIISSFNIGKVLQTLISKKIL